MTNTNTRNVYQRATHKSYAHTYPLRKSWKITAETLYYMIQKILGIIITTAGIWAGIAFEEFGIVFFALMFGLPLIFTNEKILMINDVYWNKNPTNSPKNSTKNTCFKHNDVV